MSDIRYVILSDLHFGATNSMLTSLVEVGEKGAGGDGFVADPDTPSPVLVGLLDGLRLLTRDQARPPTLVLAGDVLDLALSPDQVSATVFGGFARLAFGEHPLFAPQVHYLPGNHDHHLWETARENQYVAYAAALPAGQALAAPWHTTKLEPSDEAPEARSSWLTTLIRRQPGCEGVEVHVSYPNLAVRAPDGSRCVVVTHGHYTESIYTLMSQLRRILYPGQHPEHPEDIAVWEGENFAWIDFFWSTLGRSGDVGDDVGLVYADLSSAADLDALADRLSAALLGKGKGPKALHPLEHWVLNVIFQREVNHVARSERGTPDVTLTPKGEQGLRAYVEGPVAYQISQEWGQVPGEVHFVYGHTHKPFTEQRSFAGFPSPVQVHNTGGWVVDTATPSLVQGGVAVLVDEDLDVVSLELYRQSDGPAGTPARLLDPPAGAAPSPLYTELAGRLDPAAAPWASLSVDAARLVAQRHRQQAALAALRNPQS